MKVCFDASVVIDILGKTQWFTPAFAAYDTCMLRRFDPLLSVSSTPDIVYVLHSRGIFSKERARAAVEDVLSLFDLFGNEPIDYRNAIESGMRDYEDALIAYAAYRNGADCLVTRNKKDFLGGPIAALTPEEFLASYQVEGVAYEEVGL